ncbi:hypothetical protein [Parashewanella tropica]|uniref:hypothetical protein n=1 Tax=Parashewanella tropica TaxID=2547970 RepID=UPI001059C3F8|nr:hypothetical protein [Parashewanella tropica]
MLLNSLFCFRGKDSGLRTLAIVSASYFFAFIWMALFGLNASIVLPALAVAPVIWLSGQRRARDAQKPEWWSYALVVAWCLWAVIVYFSQNWSVSLIVGLLMLLLSALTAVPVSQGTGRYQQGYQGPAIANRAMNRTSQRVEPSLDGVSGSEVFEEISEQAQGTSSPSYQATQVSLLDRLPCSRQQLIMAVIGAIALLILTLLLTFFFAADPDSEAKPEQAVKPIEPVIERTSVEFKDGFTLSLEDNKLFMSWKGDTGEPQGLWSLATAKGDRSCQNLTFNNGSKYRPIQVNLLADTRTEAQFSPLDTAAIIKGIAKKSKASLCGYSFSLKGTQAILSRNKQFRAYIE